MDREIKGIITPVLTPMNPDETVNLQELKRQVRRQLSAGVHGIFCFGTNGEGYILSRIEKERILNAVLEEAGGKIAVYAGTGCISTRETVEFSQCAQRKSDRFRRHYRAERTGAGQRVWRGCRSDRYHPDEVRRYGQGRYCSGYPVRVKGSGKVYRCGRNHRGSAEIRSGRVCKCII